MWSMRMCPGVTVWILLPCLFVALSQIFIAMLTFFHSVYVTVIIIVMVFFVLSVKYIYIFARYCYYIKIFINCYLDLVTGIVIFLKIFMHVTIV